MEYPKHKIGRIRKKVKFEVILKDDNGVMLRFNTAICELHLKPDSARMLGMTLLDYAKECNKESAN